MIGWTKISPTSNLKNFTSTLPLSFGIIWGVQCHLIYSSAQTDDGATPHVMVTRYAGVLDSITTTKIVFKATQGGGTYHILIVGRT